MKYYAQISGREFEFRDERTLDESCGSSIAGQDTALHSIGGSLYSLLTDGHSHEVFVSPVSGGYRVQICGKSHFVAVESEKERFVRSLVSRNDETSMGFELKAPMPGLVMKILVRPGQSVKRGQGLCIIEAMKMENEIRSPVDGVVGKVFKGPADSVEKGALLMLFE